MTKYHKYFTDMMAENQALFTEFKTIHDNYAQDWKTWQTQFNDLGKKVVDIVREHETRLCAQMEKGTNSKYSATLSDKFWEEVRKEFPRIDFVGVVRS